MFFLRHEIDEGEHTDLLSVFIKWSAFTAFHQDVHNSKTYLILKQCNQDM